MNAKLINENGNEASVKVNGDVLVVEDMGVAKMYRANSHRAAYRLAEHAISGFEKDGYHIVIN